MSHNLNWTEHDNEELVKLRCFEYSSLFEPSSKPGVEPKTKGWSIIKKKMKTPLSAKELARKWYNMVDRYKKFRRLMHNKPDEYKKRKIESWPLYNLFHSALKDTYIIRSKTPDGDIEDMKSNSLINENFESKINDELKILCGEIFATPNYTISFRCNYCKKCFLNIEEFANHLKDNHSLYICDDEEYLSNIETIENVSFELVDIDESEIEDKNPYVQEEKIEIVNISPESLNIKEEIFDDNEETQSFEKVVEESQNDENILDFVENKEEMNRDKEIETSQPCKNFKCDVCNKTLSSKSSVYKHMKNLHKMYPKSNKKSNHCVRFICENCNKIFKTKSEKDKHEQFCLGPSKNKIYSCELCHKTFTNGASQKNHMIIHANLKQFKCDMCEKSFNLARGLRDHYRRHTGEKNFQCSICDKKFYSLNEKVVHERHHRKEKPYLCTECGERFCTGGKLTIHLRRHNGIKPHKCQECDKSFLNLSCLKDHQIRHSGKKSFICEICNAAFYIKSALQLHKLIHSDVRTFCCKLCDKTFKQGSGLYKHMKTHGSVKREIVFEDNDNSFDYSSVNFKEILNE